MGPRSPSCKCCLGCPQCAVWTDNFTDQEFSHAWEQAAGAEWVDADQVWQADASEGTYLDYTAAAGVTPADWPLFPVGPGQDDAVYLGHVLRFDRFLLSLHTAGVGTFGLFFEYWNGSGWSLASRVTDHSRGLKFSAVALTEDAAMGATTLWVQPLDADIDNGTLLDFGGGKTCTLTAPASRGDRTITVTPLAVAASESDSVSLPGDYLVSFHGHGIGGIDAAWFKTSINGSPPLFYLRIRRDGGTVTTDPLGARVRIAATNQVRPGTRFDNLADKGLQINSTGGAAVLARTANPYGKASHLVANVQAGSGQRLRAMIRAQDADNYLAAEATIDTPAGHGTLRMIERVAGVDTTLAGPLIVPGILADTWHQLQVCYFPDPTRSYLNASLATLDGLGDPGPVELARRWRPGETSPDGSAQAGLAIMDSGVALFDDAAFSTTALLDVADDGPCVIANPDLLDLTGWEEIRGTWSAAGGSLTTADADALLRDTVTSSKLVIVEATLTLGGAADAARLIVGYADPDNYFFIELADTGGSLLFKLGKRIDGAEHILTTTAYAGTPATDPLVAVLRLCNDNLRYSLNGGAFLGGGMGVTPPGGGVAVATGPTSTGITVASVRTLHHRSSEHPNCPGWEDLDCNVCAKCQQHEVIAQLTGSPTDITGNPAVFPATLEASGSWSYLCSPFGGSWTCSTRGTGRVLLASEFPHMVDAAGQQVLTVVLPFTAEDLVVRPRIRLLIDWLDANNYHYAAFDFNAGPIEWPGPAYYECTVGQVVAGVDTPLHSAGRFDVAMLLATEEPAFELFVNVTYVAGQSHLTAGVADVAIRACDAVTAEAFTTSLHCFTLGPDCLLLGPGYLGAFSPITPHGGLRAGLQFLDEILPFRGLKVWDCCV